MSDRASVIIGMRRNGLSPHEIAQQLDLPVSQVERALRTAGHQLCERTDQRCYSSVGQARKATATVSNKIRVYRCEHGHHFHVTSWADGPGY